MADGLQEEHCLGRQIGCSVEDVRGLLLEGLRRVKELPEDAVLCDVYVMGQNVVLMAKVPGDEGYRFTLEVYGGKTPRETSLEVLLEVLSQNGYNRREAALYAYRRHWDLLDGRWISAQRRLVVTRLGLKFSQFEVLLSVVHSLSAVSPTQSVVCTGTRVLDRYKIVRTKICIRHSRKLNKMDRLIQSLEKKRSSPKREIESKVEYIQVVLTATELQQPSCTPSQPSCS